MAKLKAPLMSLGAAGALGKALVFFGWKGLDVVREYVIPANPKSAGQVTQRGFLTDAVSHIHTHQAEASHAIDEEDIRAYALLGSTYPTPRTWFNQAVKIIVDNRVKDATYRNGTYGDGHLTPGVDQLTFETWFQFTHAIATAKLWYGTSKTALVHSVDLTVAANKLSKVVTGLTTGTKYYFQVRPLTPANAVLLRSGIYYGVPT